MASSGEMAYVYCVCKGLVVEVKPGEKSIHDGG
jgi:hypothetical protein